jgi:hypothetical protein
MRSLFAFSTAILPIFGLLAISFLLRRSRGRPATQRLKRSTSQIPGFPSEQ